MKHITTNVLIEPETWKQFKMINIQRQVNVGEALGKMVSAEVKKNIGLIQGDRV